MSAILTGTDKLLRTTNIILGSSDWTYHFWFRLNADSGPGFYQSLLTLEDSIPSFDKYVQVYTEDTGAGPQFAVAFANGVGTASIIGPVINIGQWYEGAIVKIGTQHRLYLNGTLVSTATLTFAAVTFDQLYIGYDTFATNDFNIASYREWNNDLSAAQVLAEAKWSVPALATNLQANTPLVDNPDDTTGNNNDWAETGITYEADTPYPAVNVDPTNAIDISALLPYQQIVDANPSTEFAFDLWWKYTVLVDVVALSIFGRSANYAVNRSDVDFWETPAATTGPSTSSEDNYPIVTPVLVMGDLHYISAVPSSRTANPYVVTMDIESPTATDFLLGDIFSNDDQENRPAVFLSSTVDYEFHRFANIPAGESGDIILNGNFMIGDRYTPNMKLYDKFLTLLAEFTGNHGGNHSRCIRANRATSKFYFVRNGSSGLGAIIDRVSGTGIELTFTLTGATGISLGSITPDLLDTILFHCAASANSPIVAWDIVGNVSLGTVVAGIAGQQVIDMLSLADGTYAVLRYRSSDDHAVVYHYSNSWVLTNSWDLGETITSVPPRMTWGLDDPVSVWVKMFIDSGADDIISRGNNVRLSDGVIINSVDHATFFDGAYTPILFDGSAPTALVGWPSSCPFFLMTQGETPEPPEPDSSGLYFVNPDKPEWNDSLYGDVEAKIPNPTVRTALFGE